MRLSARVGNALGNAFVLTLTKRATRGPNPSYNRPTIGPSTGVDHQARLVDSCDHARPPIALPERHQHHRPPRRPERQHARGQIHCFCAAPEVSRCIGCSSALESCVLPPPAALGRRNMAADHSLSARLERTSVSTCSMHRWATRVAGDLMRAASKAAIMNRIKPTCRPPALQLLCLCDGDRVRQTSKTLIWRHASSSSASSF